MINPMSPQTKNVRNLVLVLGDQLDSDSPVFDGFDADLDTVWMAEVEQEATHVWSHKARIALFLSAMRHFRDALHNRGVPVHYRRILDRENKGTFARELEGAVRHLRPEKLVMVEPGEWRVLQEIKSAATKIGTPLQVLPDTHFLCSTEEFEKYAAKRKQLRMEFFYREMRKHAGLLMERGQPVQGKWNFDQQNRQSFGKKGPGKILRPVGFRPDSITHEVIGEVEKRFPQHPGSLKHFDWAVTPEQARAALADFIEKRLSRFGPHQDAMWTEEPFLYHSKLSSALNLKLLDPREVATAAAQAYEEGRAAIASVEGFIRQVIGWREYVRGIYWRFMPEYLEMNTLGASRPLPGFYWTGDTNMNCLCQVIRQTLKYGYAHHIQRLMVTGLFALLLGVDPRKVHEWYLAVYVDAVEWVELPNTLGMSQHADGSLMASKPYAASGKYIQRMSDYCRECRYDPAQSTGDRACPFTTLYWDFLIRHEKKLAGNRRMRFQLHNLQRLDSGQRQQIRREASRVRSLCES